LNHESLVEAVSGLLAEPQRLQQMGTAARQLSHPDAAREIAALARKLGQK
jgi:UDP-N-acetylglucosamine:LPS N-acetylglucosamine transferase